MLGLDLDSWNGVLVVSLFLAALAAVVVGVATFAVIRLQRAEEIATKAEFDRYKVEAGERASALVKETKRLSAEAEGAKAEIAAAQSAAASATERAAQASERAAFLEKEAAQARLEQEQLKQVVIWRTIPPEAYNRIIDELKSSASSVTLLYPAAQDSPHFDPNITGAGVGRSLL